MDLREKLFGKKTKPEDEYSFEERLTNRQGASNKMGLVGTFDESKMARYKMAMEKKALLFDKEDKHGVDYTHMDFVLSTGCNFHEGMTNLVAIQLFWKAFYPYLKNITESYERFYDQFRAMIDDQEDVLAKHAELDFKMKWTENFLKDKKTEDGKSLKWQLECFIEQKMQEAIAANPAPEKRAVDELPEVRQ